ncbi:PAS domain-containing protein [Streptomyces sp. NPDC002845]
MSSRPSRGAARLAAILDALPDALVLVNANGTVVNANTIALEAFETPGTALVGRGLLDLLPEFDSRLIPGSMRRPDSIDPRGRTKPTRMMARRTDGSEFPVEVTSANLENGQQAYDGYGYANDELLMLVVRDLSGTVDTEAELARSQRQTEMILRAASEGVVGTDTDGRIVLVNPAAVQILGYRASDLGGRELHTLLLHSREDGSPFPYAESPLADTLRSGRKHRVRGQVLWSKSGDRVPVDLTTAPVRDGDQLVGAVMTFTDRRPYDTLADEREAEAKQHADELERIAKQHADELEQLRETHGGELREVLEKHAEELAANDERYAALGEREKDRYEALAARHDQLLSVLATSLRGPLDQLRGELGKLAADDAGQLWPEANQVLHHLTAGYSRITTLIDNVLGYQRLDSGDDGLVRTAVMLDAVVAAGVDGAVDLIGPGRVQFAVHAPPIEAEVDQQRLAGALAHLIADVAGVDATGSAPVSAGGYMDNTVVVAAAQRGEVVRIEVRGPYAGGDPVHQPIVTGIVRAHGGVLQTHEVPGMSGSAYVLEVPIGGGAGAVPLPAVPEGSGAEVALPEQAAAGGGRRRARRSSVDAFLESEGSEGSEGSAGAGNSAENSGSEKAEVGAAAPPAAPAAPTGRRRRRAAPAADGEGSEAARAEGNDGSGNGSRNGSGGTGRRRGRPSPAEAVSEGAVVTAAEHAAGAAAVATGLGEAVPPQGVPAPSGRRARRDGEQHALPPALPAAAPASAPNSPDASGEGAAAAPQPTGRRRRALANANERAAAQAAQEAENGGRAVFALPPAEADRTPTAPAAPQTPQTQPAPQTSEVPQYEGAEVAASAGQGAVPGQPGQPGQAGQAGQEVVGQAGGVPGAPGVAVAPGAGAPGGAQADDGRHDAALPDPADDHTPPQPHPVSQPTGRRRARQQGQGQDGTTGAPAQGVPAQGVPAHGQAQAVAALGPAGQGAVPGQGTATGPGIPGQGAPGQGLSGQGLPGQAVPAQAALAAGQAVPGQNAQSQVAVPPQGVPAAPPQAVAAQGVPTAPAQQQPVPAQGIPGAAQPIPAQGMPGATAQPVPAQGVPGAPIPGQPTPTQGAPAPVAQSQPVPAQGVPTAGAPGQAVPVGQAAPVSPTAPAQSIPAQATAPTAPPAAPQNPQPQPHPQAQAQAQPAAPQAPQPWPAGADTPTGGIPAQATAPGAPQPQPQPQAQPQPTGTQDTSATGTPVPPTTQPQPQPQPWPGPDAPGTADTTGAAPQPQATGTPVPPTTQPQPQPQPWPGPDAPAAADTTGAAPHPQAPGTPAPGTPLPAERPVQPRAAQPLPAEAAAAQPAPTTPPIDPNSTQGRAISVRTLGQGVPFARQPQPGGTPPPHQSNGSGRRRKLGTPPEPPGERPETTARPHPQPGQSTQSGQPAPQTPPAPVPAQPSLAGQSRLAGATDGAGRSYAIGAPDKNAVEGPEPLDGPGGAVEVSDQPHPQPMDDELPPEPLDNPRRLLVWPAPDVTTQQALSDRGYRPVTVNSREEVDAQIAAFPAALFVDPLTGPITRTALQSLRQAAVAAEVPVLVTAGLGQATREAAYGADPAVLLKALAPRDSEQHPPRVLLVEEHPEIALALTATLERRGVQVARATSDADAVTLAAQMRPNLVVMGLMQVRRREAGVVDWLRANGLLNRTPLVVYTAAVDQADLPRLASGETVLFLAERSTSPEVQTRIVELLARIGTN